MELCSLCSPARLSHSSLVTICAVARLVRWLPPPRLVLANTISSGWGSSCRQLHHSWCTPGRQKFDIHALKLRAVFKRRSCKAFWSVNHCLLYQIDYLFLCQTVPITLWVWGKDNRICLSQQLSSCLSLYTLGDELSGVFAFSPQVGDLF